MNCIFLFVASMCLGWAALAQPPQITVLESGTEYLSFQKAHEERQTKEDEYHVIDLAALPENVRQALILNAWLKQVEARQRALSVIKTGCAFGPEHQKKVDEQLSAATTKLSDAFQNHPEHFCLEYYAARTKPRPPASLDNSTVKTPSHVYDDLESALPDRPKSIPFVRLRGIECLRSQADLDSLSAFSRLTYYDPTLDNLEAADCLLYRTLPSWFFHQFSDGVDTIERTITRFYEGATASASIGTAENLKFFMGGAKRTVGLLLKPHNVQQALICASPQCMLTQDCSHLLFKRTAAARIIEYIAHGVQTPDQCLKKESAALLGVRHTEAVPQNYRNWLRRGVSEVLLATEHVNVVGLFLFTDVEKSEDLTDSLHIRCRAFAKEKNLPLVAIKPAQAKSST